MFSSRILRHYVDVKDVGYVIVSVFLPYNDPADFMS